MARSGSNAWDDDYEIYSPSQVEGILEYCNIEVVSDTFTHFLAYCPFHGNTDTPAFAVDKNKGLWHCFNPSCEYSGKLVDLILKTKGDNLFQALRKINYYKTHDTTPFADRMAEALAKPVEFTPFPQDALDRMKDAFPNSPGHTYMMGRGFEDEVLDYFDIGYSAKQNMVAVPMHDPSGNPIGIIGRSIVDKTFKNSTGLPKAKTMWNFHRARKTGGTLILTEASFDAMRVHQAGYPNVGALLGGHVSDWHLAQIDRNFSKIIYMTDFDPKQYRPNCRMCGYKKCVGHRPGRDLARSIIHKLPNKKHMWGAYDDKAVFPHGAKDASDMTDDEIRQCLRNAVSNLEYSRWNIEEKDGELVA